MLLFFRGLGMSISGADDRLGISFSDAPSLDLCNIPDVLSSAGDACEIAQHLLAVDQQDSGSDCVAMDSPEEEPYIDVVSEDSAIQEENLDGSLYFLKSHIELLSSAAVHYVALFQISR